MGRVIHFYFDLVSPFAYLANVRLPGIAERHGCELAYHPMDIPAAKQAAGNYGPSIREVPAKIKVLGADLERWARHYEVPLKFPRGFDCRPWNIGVLYAIAHERAREYVDAAYARIWGAGIDLADSDELTQLAERLPFDTESFLDYVRSPGGEADFQSACDTAHAAGVFGAPIMMVDDEVFWGNDRLMFLEQYLQPQGVTIGASGNG